MNLRVTTPREDMNKESKKKKPNSGSKNDEPVTSTFSIKQHRREKSAAHPTRSKSHAWKHRRNTAAILPSAGTSTEVPSQGNIASMSTLGKKTQTHTIFSARSNSCVRPTKRLILSKEITNPSSPVQSPTGIKRVFSPRMAIKVPAFLKAHLSNKRTTIQNNLNVQSADI
jgi:hypothetical protein